MIHAPSLYPLRSGSFQNFGATSLCRRPTPCRLSSLSGSQRISFRRSPICRRCPCRRSRPRYVLIMTSISTPQIKRSRHALLRPHRIHSGIRLSGRGTLGSINFFSSRRQDDALECRSDFVTARPCGHSLVRHTLRRWFLAWLLHHAVDLPT